MGKKEEEMKLINSVKLQGIVEHVEQKYRSENISIHEVRLIVARTQETDFYSIVKMFGKHVEQEGFGVGAWVQVTGYLTANEGKDGRWFGNATASKVTVVVAAPVTHEKPAEAVFEDDDIPF